MLNLLLILLPIVFFSTIFFKTLFWLHLWQVKEYRLDRLVVHLKETIQGRELVFGKRSFVRVLLILAYAITVFGNFLTVYTTIILGFFIFNSYLTFQTIRARKLKMPDFTAKILFIFVSICFFSITFYIFAPIDVALWVLVIDLLIPLMIGLEMLLFSIPADFLKDSTINRAIQKRERLSSLLVIGITGSYGKGSTKEYMYSILSQKYNVSKTLETYNTPIGIARALLKDVNENTKIFIVEMGAYKKGEIQFMSNMVKPLIGVLTAVNEQHISLFGSIENTMKAKYELIDSIPNNGISLFNGNNANALKLYRKTRKKRILYGVDYARNPIETDILAMNVTVKPLFLRFSITMRGKLYANFQTNLIGAHHIENLLPGIWIAEKMGMTEHEIKKALLSIFPFKKTMEPYSGINQAILIDDTFNANPASVIAGINYMKIFKGKKYLVLQPMIELGAYAEKHHFEIGKSIGYTCDVLFLTNKNFYRNIKKGIEIAHGKTKIFLLSQQEIANKITELSENDVVVFEGKEAGNAFGLVEKRKVFEG